jgi:hypothetical protein
VSKEPALGKNEPIPYDAKKIDLDEVEGYLKACIEHQKERHEDPAKREEWWNNVQSTYELYKPMGAELQLWRVKGNPRKELFEGRPYSIVFLDAFLNATCSCNRHEGDDKCKHIHAVALKYPDQERYVIAGIRPYVSPVTGHSFYRRPTVSNTDRDPSSILIEQLGESAIPEKYNKAARYLLNAFRANREDKLDEVIAIFETPTTSLRINATGQQMTKARKRKQQDERKEWKKRKMETGESMTPAEREALRQIDDNDRIAMQFNVGKRTKERKQNKRAESISGTEHLVLTPPRVRLKAQGLATQDHKLGRNTDVDWNTLVERYSQELQRKTQPLTQPSDDQLTQPNGPP